MMCQDEICKLCLNDDTDYCDNCKTEFKDQCNVLPDPTYYIHRHFIEKPQR